MYGTYVIPNPGLTTKGINIWKQKTGANNMAMVAEASYLMRAHRPVNSARQSLAQ
jgi:hypothetical protein